MSATPSEEHVTWRNGAKVSNRERLLRRANIFAFLKDAPARAGLPTHPDGIALARSRSNKGWAKRYLRARGLPL